MNFRSVRNRWRWMTQRNAVWRLSSSTRRGQYYRRVYAKFGCHRRSPVPGVFNMDHLQPIEPILYWKYSIFFSLSYWEANSYYPRNPIMGKGSSPNSEIGRGKRALVPRPFKLDPLQPIKPLLLHNFSKFFSFILGGQFLLPQRANIGKRAIIQPQN